MLADAEYGTNWICFGSDLMNNKAKTIPLEYVSKWRPIVIQKKKKEHK